MRIHIDLPWGGSLDIEWTPMDKDKFYAVCLLAGAAMVVTLFITIITR